MAFAIEGYNRAQTGQTISVKKQSKTTSTVKPSTIIKDNPTTKAAVYTAGRFEDIQKNKSTYTAQATYTNPVLAKKQNTITQVAQTNKEAAKTTPIALSAAKSFFGGVVKAGISTAQSLGNLALHPVQTIKGVGTAIASSIQTAEAIKEIAVEQWDDFKKGDANVKAHMIGRVVGEIGLAVGGVKAVDLSAKAVKALKAAQAAKAAGKTGKVAEAAEVLADGAKVIDTAVGNSVSKNVGLEIVSGGTKGVSNPVDIELRYKSGWTVEQKAEADAKVKALTEAPTIKTAPKRSGTSASSRYKSANGVSSVPSGKDVDHIIDLQLGGADDILNMNPLDKSVNRSLGKQIQNKIKDYPVGTEFDKFTIK